jgi:cytochrome c biogenesis protein
MLTHLGISMTLLATLYGAFTNFTAQQVAEPGDAFQLAEAQGFRTSTQPPYWFGRIPRWDVVVDDFTIYFNPKAPTIPQQFKTRLRILDAKTTRLLALGETQVNRPFRYKGVTFYQAEFAPTTKHQLRINGTLQTINANQTLAGRPFARVPVDANTGLYIFPLGRFSDGMPTNRLHILVEKQGRLLGYQQGFRPENRNMLSLEEGGAAGTLGGLTLQYPKAVMATGLQIKYAPEVTFLYISLAILAAGCLLSLVPHHQVWLALYSPEAHEDGHDAPPTQLVFLPKAKKRPMALHRSLEKAFQLLPPPVYRLQHKQVEPATSPKSF